MLQPTYFFWSLLRMFLYISNSPHIFLSLLSINLSLSCLHSQPTDFLHFYFSFIPTTKSIMNMIYYNGNGGGSSTHNYHGYYGYRFRSWTVRQRKRFNIAISLELYSTGNLLMNIYFIHIYVSFSIYILLEFTYWFMHIIITPAVCLKWLFFYQYNNHFKQICETHSAFDFGQLFEHSIYEQSFNNKKIIKRQWYLNMIINVKSVDLVTHICHLYPGL